jgi:hypothetical protein
VWSFEEGEHEEPDDQMCELGRRYVKRCIGTMEEIGQIILFLADN